FYIDQELLSKALEAAREAPIRIDAELAAVTDGVVKGIGQVEKLKVWLAERECPLPSIEKKKLEAALRRRDLAPNARRALELRYEGAQAAAKKLERFQQCCGADGRVRGSFMYYGAGTGRWSGAGVQPQNLKRAEDLEPLVEAILNGKR